MQPRTSKNGFVKKIVISLIFSWGLTLISMPSLAESRMNALEELSVNFKKAPNRMSRVTITNFVPLSTAVAGNADTFVGFAFLTQDDAVISAGVGATFKF